jgi:phage tail protein, P2 protein I family
MPDPKEIRKNGQDIYTVNFAQYLPESLKKDPKIRAIAEAVTKEALTVSRDIEKVLIYFRLDELPEELIDILAYDMHVDWYDYSYPLEIKRDILKNSVKVHKRMGTKYAVETVLKSIYKTTGIKEWFEYGGKPYWFKIVMDIGNEGLTAYVVKDIWEKIYFYKNLRSHCNGIFCTLKTQGKLRIRPYAGVGGILKVKAYLVDKLYAEECVTRLLPKTVVGEKLKVKAGLTGKITERTNNETILSCQRIKNIMVVGKGQ